MRTLVCVISICVMAAACGDAASQPGKTSQLEVKVAERPALDEAAAKQAVDALRIVAPEQRSLLAARALFELEAGRIPAPASTLLESLPTLPPEGRALAIAKALSEPPLLEQLDALCSGKARDAMQAAAMAEPAAKSPGLWRTCDLRSVRLMSEQEAAASPPMPMMLAHLLARHLEHGGGLHETETTLLRELARG